MKTAARMGLAAVLILSAAACGRMGELEPPGRETERAPRGPDADPITEPSTVNRPPSQVPIDGAPRNPF